MLPVPEDRVNAAYDTEGKKTIKLYFIRYLLLVALCSEALTLFVFLPAQIYLMVDIQKAKGCINYSH